MDKMQMAHDWAMKHGSELTYMTVENAWQYADAMQAEADKRENKERPEVLKEEWYPEYEHGRDYPSDAWVTFNGEARLAVSIKEESIRKRPQ